MNTGDSSSSVWPGYVAAVSSLVLSLLLLAGVLVVAISQAGRVVDAYNRQLVAAVIADEIELQSLNQTLQARTAEQAQLQRALSHLNGQAPSPTGAASVRNTPTVTTYRLVFAAGAKGLDDATLQQLKQHVHQASVNGRIQHWQLQVGVRGLDKEVEREAFRLMMAVRQQLIDMGIPADRMVMRMQRERSMDEVSGASTGMQAGDITLMLKPESLPQEGR
jgi:hypothetical protein